MQADILAMLSGVGSWTLRTALILFVLLNGTAVALVAIRRDRTMVNRWTSRWLAANIALLGAGAGIPLLTGLLRAGLSLLTDFLGGGGDWTEVMSAGSRPSRGGSHARRPATDRSRPSRSIGTR